MPGNSPRPGRRTSNKKGATKGSGGQRRRGLEGKGPTPPAEQRTGHAKQRAAQARARRQSGRQAQRGRQGAASTEIVVGRNPVFEALRAGVPATTLYVQQFLDSDDRVTEAVKLAMERGGVNLLEAPKPELDRITGYLNHQGLALQVPPYEYAHPDDLVADALEAGQQPLIVALDGVTDPRNLGAVVRSAAAFGGHGVVVPERRSASMTAGAWKASAGTAARTPVARATNLTRTLQTYQKAGLMVVGLAADGDTDLADLDVLADPVAIVISSEGRGLSRLVGEACDLRVRIPMPGGAESLNAGVAAGIVLYEAARRRA
jgi:23S rRNA (guanosine2251-2'-O)-methyltransferase